jgi:hypothetical protein
MFDGNKIAYFALGSFTTLLVFMGGSFLLGWTDTVCHADKADGGVLIADACWREWASALGGWAAATTALVVLVPQLRFMRAQIMLPSYDKDIQTLDSDISALQEIESFMGKEAPTPNESKYANIDPDNLQDQVDGIIGIMRKFDDFIDQKAIQVLSPTSKDHIRREVINNMRVQRKNLENSRPDDFRLPVSEGFPDTYDTALAVFASSLTEVSTLINNLTAEREDMSGKVNKLRETATK